jgi:CDP-2,3-bis-(O-geranylgeranyl)-sn-glycerol synthase
MWELIIKSVYFFLPVYFANMAPVILKKLPALNQPVWERKLGKNKTWRGIVVAIVMGTLIFYLQKVAYQNGFTSIALIDYTDFSIMLGFLMGLGAIVGDMVGSYYKRKANIAPGKPWPVYDQLDFVVGAFAFSFIVYIPPAEMFLVILILSPLLHVLFNLIGYWLKFKKNKF